MTLEERIETLESQLSRIRRRESKVKALALLVVLAAGVSFLWAVYKPSERQEKTIRAERFEVTRDGKTVAVLTADSNGGRLGIYNKDGKPVARLSAEPDGGEFKLMTPAGGVRFKAP